MRETAPQPEILYLLNLGTTVNGLVQQCNNGFSKLNFDFLKTSLWAEFCIGGSIFIFILL